MSTTNNDETVDLPASKSYYWGGSANQLCDALHNTAPLSFKGDDKETPIVLHGTSWTATWYPTTGKLVVGAKEHARAYVYPVFDWICTSPPLRHER